MTTITALTRFGDLTFPVRRLKAAQLAALRVLGEGVVLEEYDNEETMQGRYRVVTMPEAKSGEYADKHHAFQISAA